MSTVSLSALGGRGVLRSALLPSCRQTSPRQRDIMSMVLEERPYGRYILVVLLLVVLLSLRACLRFLSESKLSRTDRVSIYRYTGSGLSRGSSGVRMESWGDERRRHHEQYGLLQGASGHYRSCSSSTSVVTCLCGSFRDSSACCKDTSCSVNLASMASARAVEKASRSGTDSARPRTNSP